MEESLKSLFTETANLIIRYGNCLLKDPNINEKDWENLSSHMINICDEQLKQEVTFKGLGVFKEDIFSELNDLEDLEDESVIFQFKHEIQLTYEKLELGRKNAAYKDFEESVLNKINKKNVENDVTAVSVNVNVVDPITKLRLINPVKNAICGHVYEKATIMQLLDAKKITKCPIPGCVAATKIFKKDLVPDAALKKYLQENP